MQVGGTPCRGLTIDNRWGTCSLAHGRAIIPENRAYAVSSVQIEHRNAPVLLTCVPQSPNTDTKGLQVSNRFRAWEQPHHLRRACFAHVYHSLHEKGAYFSVLKYRPLCDEVKGRHADGGNAPRLQGHPPQ